MTLIFAFAVVLLATPFTQAQNCGTRANGAFWVDPDNCAKFYRCANGATSSFVCPGDLLFNEAISVCDYPGNVNCAGGSTACSPNPCENSGSCSVGANDQAQCQCITPTFGDRCQFGLPDRCLSGPCQNGGVCSNDIFSGYVCSCPVGTSGDNCQNTVSNSCSTFPCLNGGDCRNTVSGYVCTCLTGFFGTNCENSDLLPVKPGKPTTSPPEVNFCQGQPCENGGTCENGIDTFICRCRPGFFGIFCEFEGTIDYCLNHQCQNDALCVSEELGYACVCQFGFSGDLCENDVCDKSRCQNGGSCVRQSVSNFFCQCPPSYTGDSCQTRITSCENNACLNGATCINDGNSQYSCNCVPGFTGEFCESTGQIDHCVNNICNTGATCLNGPTNYTCSCPFGFSGPYCQIDNCAGNRCTNGATCFRQTVGYYCACRTGYTGDYCQQGADPCNNNNCQNGGICKANPFGGYDCQCPRGYTGTYCQFDPCFLNDCAAGSTCTFSPLVTGFTCVCPNGFTGTLCNQAVTTDPCGSSPCKNGGLCSSSGASFNCTCPEGYAGRICENQQPCPAYPCPDTVSSFRYPDWNSLNCQGYYRCTDGSLVREFCSGSTAAFDPFTMECEEQSQDNLCLAYQLQQQLGLPT